MVVLFINWHYFIVFKWKHVIIFSIKLLMVVLCRGVCYLEIIFLAKEYELVDGLLYFNFIFGNHKKLNTLFFTRILFLWILKLGLKKYFHAILEVHVLCANISIGKVRTSPRLQFQCVIIYTVTSDIITYYGTTISISCNSI